MNQRIADIIGTLLFSSFSGYMTYVFWTCIRDGRIYFGQGKDASRRESPRKYYSAIRYHLINIIIFDLASLFAILKYIFGIDILN